MTKDIQVASYEEVAIQWHNISGVREGLRIPGKLLVLWVLHDPARYDVSFEDFKLTDLKYSIYPAFHADTIVVFSQDGRVRTLKSRNTE